MPGSITFIANNPGIDLANEWVLYAVESNDRPQHRRVSTCKCTLCVCIRDDGKREITDDEGRAKLNVDCAQHRHLAPLVIGGTLVFRTPLSFGALTIPPPPLPPSPFTSAYGFTTRNYE